MGCAAISRQYPSHYNANQYATMKLAPKQGSIRLPGGKNRQRIEDSIQLEDYVKFSSLKGDVGAAVLSDGKNYQFKFGFKLKAVHPTISDEEFASIVTFIETGLKSIPAGETMFIVQSVVPDNRLRLQNYREMVKNAPTPLFREMAKSAASPGEYFTNMSLQDRINSARSRYKRKSITIYVTATSNQSSNVKDKSEVVIRKGIEIASNIWSKFTGEKTTETSEQIRQIFINAQAVYEDWDNTLSAMRLEVTPMGVDDLVTELWEEFNKTPVRALPQVMEWTGDDLLYQMNNDIHLSSWLFESQDSVPKAARDFVFQVRSDGVKRLSGVVTMRNKPGGWADPTAALKYLYDKTAGLEDYKVVVTLTKASASLTEKNVELLQRQAQDSVKMAQRARVT